MFKKILVPLDGSEPSEAGVELAVKLAAESGSEVLFCHIVDAAQAASRLYPGVDPSFVRNAGRDVGQAMVGEAESRATRAGVRNSGVVVEGLRLDAILDLAKQHEVDLIVMGSHGRSGIARAFLGSTTEGILRHTPVPVLVAAHVRVPAAV